MSRLMLILPGMLFLVAASPASNAAGLAWLSGRWVEVKGQSWTEETWTRARGGVMLGVNLRGKGQASRGYEFLRIAPDKDGVLTYWASPAGRAAVPFRLVSTARAAATFENPEHDYPTRISYRRNRNTLVATISGPGGQRPMTWNFSRG